MRLAKARAQFGVIARADGWAACRRLAWAKAVAKGAGSTRLRRLQFLGAWARAL